MASQVDPQMKHSAAKTALGARDRNTLAPYRTNTAGLQVATKAFLMGYDCCLEVVNDLELKGSYEEEPLSKVISSSV